MKEMPSRWLLGVVLGWLLVLLVAAWYLGGVGAQELNPGPPVMVWLVIGMFFVASFTLGAVLMSERKAWLLLAAWLGGSLITPIVFFVSVFGLNDVGLFDLPLLLSFLEFAVLLLVPIAVGATLGRVVRRGHLGGLLIVGAAAIALTELVIAFSVANRHPEVAAEQHLSNIAAHSSTPIYYVGRRFHGLELDDPTIFPNDSGTEDPADHSFDPGDELYVGYGSTCTDDECGDEFEIQMRRGPLRFPAECVLWSPGPRGTLLVRERFGSWDAVTGDQTLRVETISRDDMVDFVNALRPVGDRVAHPRRDLPAPSAEARRRVRDACPQSGDGTSRG